MSPTLPTPSPSPPIPQPFPPLSRFPDAASLSTRGSRRVTRLFLCRHGETEANAARVLQGSGIDLPLNAKGMRQADALGVRMAGERIAAVWASNLQRAIQTAKAVAMRHPSASFHSDANLREISWGGWEGQADPQGLFQMMERWERDHDFDAKAPGSFAESPNMVRDRLDEVIGQIVESGGEDGAVLVVAHGRTLRVLLAHLIYRSLKHMPAFRHENCCINVVDALVEVLPSPSVPTDATTAENSEEDQGNESDSSSGSDPRGKVRLDGDATLSHHHLAHPEDDGWVGPEFVFQWGGGPKNALDGKEGRTVRVRFKPALLNYTGHLAAAEREHAHVPDTR
ncbi:phosphoglycerate mutase-like protein [Gonapodya prolifera JEL478]|uniref:Phosphoglycerate mutase-like protein n=1 Tax=Gonapodya prolifera (strain JEL478) TaxID=1344416 RepID=A0A139ARD9_GONPJ|nr:phosphoglycerate mutase-like protein [Gonapodya prolifera JEL478]|eukprot:KXS19292.1 phosphoglycerate mutase-like protein [Gonapodya prolifera JEL478]